MHAERGGPAGVAGKCRADFAVAESGKHNVPGTYIFRDGGEDAAFALNTTTNAVTYNGDANTTSVQLSNGNPISTSVPGSQLFRTRRETHSARCKI